MYYSTKEFGINSKTGASSDGGLVSGRVIINESPTLNYQVTTKGYVEEVKGTLSAWSFNNGYLQGDAIPSFSGELIKTEGSTSLVLKQGVVSSGTYCKVLVNEKGLVTLGMPLVDTDLPSLSFDKLINKPNTLIGYGISNVLTTEGNEMLGTLRVTECIDTNDLANKAVADYYQMDTNIEIGSYVYKTNKHQTPYFLRCNGSDVAISMYGGLYNVIGDMFSIGFTPGYGLPHLHQLDYNASGTTTASWSSQSTIPATRNSGQALVTKNKVFLIGGRSTVTNTGSVNTIYTASINTSTGVIGSWSTYGSLPITLDSFELVVYLNRVYLIGGNNNGTIINSIYSCLIDNEGNLGSWVLIGTLPFVLKGMSCIITKNLLTCIGGEHTSGIIINVIQCQINDDGTLGSWYSCPNLPSGRRMASVLPVKNWVYLIGGNSGSSSVSTVYRTSINNNGTLGEWSTYGSIPAQRQECGIISTGNRVHLIGGGTSSSLGTSNYVYTAVINSDGSLGSWTRNSDLAESVRSCYVFITATRLYICGGYRSTTRISSVRFANFIGGLNDYSEWYSEEKKATSVGYFRLPYKESNLLGTECFIRC